MIHTARDKTHETGLLLVDIMASAKPNDPRSYLKAINDLIDRNTLETVIAATTYQVWHAENYPIGIILGAVLMRMPGKLPTSIVEDLERRDGPMQDTSLKSFGERMSRSSQLCVNNSGHFNIWKTSSLAKLSAN